MHFWASVEISVGKINACPAVRLSVPSRRLFTLDGRPSMSVPRIGIPSLLIFWKTGTIDDLCACVQSWR